MHATIANRDDGRAGSESYRLLSTYYAPGALYTFSQTKCILCTDKEVRVLRSQTT